MSVSIDGLRDLTFDDFVELPEELHKGAELFDGVVRVTSPIIKHQRAVVNVVFAMESWRRAESGRGRLVTDYLARINDRSGYKPDVAWYPAGRIPGTDGPEWRGVPAVVVEVLSPSTRRVDQVRKPGGYASIGVDEVWIVDVDDQSVLLLRQPAGAGYAEAVELPLEETITSPLLPGFSLPVADVFAE